MSERTHRLLAFLALFALGVLLLFVRLGNGPFEVWDEGLYGNYAQNALHSHQYLHAVDEHGVWPQKWAFSKPPLTLWVVALSFKLLGPTVFALRLPFACAALAVALLMFAWGCRLAPGKRGSWLGFSWGVCWLLSHGLYHWGRTATIEPLLITFVLAALYCYARALDGTRAELGWAGLSGLCVLLAFLTKQIVCALALGPIFVVELARIRHGKLAAALLRLWLTFVLPSVAMGTWIALMWRSAGKQAQGMLWQHAVVKRVTGYDGGMHKNFLNRAADQLTQDAPPLSWQLGLVAFALCLVYVAHKHARSQDAWLLGGMCVLSWATFDVGSRSMLPWYILNLLPAVSLGCAWALTHAAGAALQAVQPVGMEAAAAGLGAAVFAEWAVFQSKGVVSSIFVAGMVAVVAAVVAVRPEHKKWLFSATFTAWLALTLAGLYRRDGYHNAEPYPVAKLGEALYRAGARRISVDERLKLAHHTRGTFFGPLSASSDAPWELSRHSYDARVEQVVVPREAPVAAKRLLRAPGLSAFMGELHQDPLSAEALVPVLEKGKLTFEAEDLESERWDTLRRDEKASCWHYRGFSPRDASGKKPKANVLAKGQTLQLPAGDYDAAFYLRTACATEGKREPVGRIGVDRAGSRSATSKSVSCEQAQRPDGSFVPLKVSFTLTTARSVELYVRDVQGSIALDRITLRRRP